MQVVDRVLLTLVLAALSPYLAAFIWIKVGRSETAIAQNKLYTRGEKLFFDRNCRTCHGDGGYQPVHESYPKLAGQNREYVRTQLLDMLAGRRTNGMSPVMKEQLEGLSVEEMDALAVFVSLQK